MKTRAFSLTLALLFAASAAVASAPGACCAPIEEERTLIAVDCCSTMAECPLQLKSRGPAVVQAEGKGLPANAPAIAPQSPAALLVSRSEFQFEPDRPSHAGPPLYRLHAQLLI